jgi:hypothetical protein
MKRVIWLAGSLLITALSITSPIAAAPLDMAKGIQVADMLLGADVPVNPLFYDDRAPIYGQRQELAGSEDLNASMPPTAAGGSGAGFQVLPDRAPPDTPVNPLF